MQQRVMRNRTKTWFLFALMLGILVAIGGVISASSGSAIWIVLFTGIGLVSTAVMYWNSDKIALRSMQAYAADPQQFKGLYDMVHELAQRAGEPAPRIYIAPSQQPNAFATGRNPQNAAICFTEGIMHLLDPRELRAVTGHELMHVYNRDILTSSIAAAIGTVIQGAAYMLMFSRNNNNVLFSLLGAILAPLAAGLVQAGISRDRETSADHDGAQLTGDPLALASALQKISGGVQRHPMPADDHRVKAASHMMIASPFAGKIRNWFSTHPAMEDRVERLNQIARDMGQQS
ncbi:M48 family metalloprotease [Yaniella halotolerans]|uniref:M48 family metalloprotease n=1 Tax=Yaniella halotolerans TaxID=225453 RepID=UPI0003B5BDD1|nr:M48 family metalloprotease [Yaniella halotolerans]